jgi:hypothetical protein
MQDQEPTGIGRSRKNFTHPINRTWIDAFVPRAARIMDYGCGRGTAELVSLE